MLGTLVITNCFFGQNTGCEKLKTEITALNTANLILNEENSYLKKILKINNPVMEADANQFKFKITKVIGDSGSKTIFFTLLIENFSDDDMHLDASDAVIIDLEGNKPERKYDKESNIYPELKNRFLQRLSMLSSMIILRKKNLELSRFFI